MNTSLFKRLAHDLLQKHYGIGIDDTTLGMDVAALVKEGTRPYEAVNQHAQACDLDRIDRKGPFGVPGKDPLTSQDELAIIVCVRPVELVDDQPTCCHYCGSRTGFNELKGGRQHHHCLNDWCGSEFIAEPDPVFASTH